MPQNYLQAFRGPDLAQIDRDAYSNALLRNEVQRLPQRNAAEDFSIRADQETHQARMTESQRKNALGILGRGFAMISSAPNAKGAAQAFLSSQDFQAAGKLAGLPIEQFSVTDQDTDDALRQQAAAWAQALSGQPAAQQMETIPGPDGALLQRDPSTGKLTQVMGRDQSFDRLLMQDELARRRDEAGRNFQREQASQKPTTGQDAVDREFAQEYVAFRASGGYADVEKGLQQLKQVVEQLESGANITGFGVGNTPGPVRAVTNPQAQAAKDNVEEVVQRNLRLILGAQFTEREGTRLIERAYNPRLGEAENARRVKRLMQQIEAAARSKLDASRYFEQHGTLRGWTGKTYALDDFEDAVGPSGASGGGDLAERVRMLREEVERLERGGR